MRISYVSGPCGSGKSYQFAQRAIAQSHAGYATVIVCQTTMLLDQYAEMIGSAATVFCIHHKNSTGVISTIYRSLSALVDASGIMLVTFSTFQLLKLGHSMEHLDIIFDEIPSIIDPTTLNIAASHQLITDHITRLSDSSVHSLLIGRNHKALTAVFENRKNDATYAGFRDIAGKLISDHWVVYTNTAQYLKLMSNNVKYRPEQIDFFPILKTSIFKGFRSVIIGAANFEDSLLYALLESDPDITIRSHVEITSRLRYSRHTNGKLIDIHYGFSKWSKNFIKNTDALGKIVAAFETVLAGKSYVWAGNKGQEDVLFSAGKDNRLPSSPHGLNAFQHFHNVATVGAYNLKPSVINFFDKKYGISAERIRTAINNEVNYQIICRISIRDTDDDSPKIVCVPDIDLARWLQSKFPGSRIHSLGISLEGDSRSISPSAKPKRERKPNRIAKEECIARKKERQRERYEELLRRFEQARLRLPEEEAFLSVSSPHPSGSDSTNPGNTNDLIDIGQNVTHFFGSFWRSKFDTKHLSALACDDFDELTALMKTFHKTSYPSKEDNLLISPTLYWARGSDIRRRTRDDALYCGTLWLDNDGNGDGSGISERDFHLFSMT